jgi:sugar phosphate isomerase/epimerase
MKLACADFAFPLLPHDDVLCLISMLNFEGIDIGLFENRSHLWPSKEFAAGIEKSGRELKRKLDDLNLTCADVFLQMDADFKPFAVNHPDATRRAKARDWFLKTLDYASAANCKHVTTLPGVHNENEDYESSFSCAVDELAWRSAEAEQRHIVFGTECHVGSLAPDPQSALRLARSTPGLTLTLDYTHFTRSGLPDADVHPLLEYASHFHARGARTGRLQCAVKDNTINYQEIVSRLKSLNYPGYLGVEYVWIDWEQCNTCDNLSETILLRDQLRSYDTP